MTVTEVMLRTYPKSLGNVDERALARCIDACVECAQACTACADACLSEEMVAELTKCIGREERTGDSFGLGRECERLG